MPLNHLHQDGAAPDVLSQVTGFPGIPALAEKFIPVDKVRELYHRVRESSAAGFGLEKLLTEMRVELRLDAGDTARIPASGPVVVVANHPFGMLDGAVLAVLLTRMRPDVKVMTNHLLRDVPELAQHCIFVDPFQGEAAPGAKNIVPLFSNQSNTRHRGVSLTILPRLVHDTHSRNPNPEHERWGLQHMCCLKRGPHHSVVAHLRGLQ